MATAIPCGDDVDAVGEVVRRFADAGFTDLAPVRGGGDHQTPFLRRAPTTPLRRGHRRLRAPFPRRAETTLRPALRDL